MLSDQHMKLVVAWIQLQDRPANAFDFMIIRLTSWGSAKMRVHELNIVHTRTLYILLFWLKTQILHELGYMETSASNWEIEN